MNRRNLFLPLLGYGLISLIVTWPLITHLQGWVPGVGDWGQNMWALWWTRQSLLILGQSPFYTNYLFYPEGVTLLFHPLDLADGLLALPLYSLVGGDITYNLLILFSFICGGWGMYLLSLHLLHHRAASFIAGLIFALSPYHFLRIDLGHLNLSTLQWIPFYLLFLLKFIEKNSKRSASLAIFFLIVMALHSWYYVIYCGMLSLALIFWPRKNIIFRLKHILIVLGIALLLLSPLLIPMFRLLNTTVLVGEHDPLRHSVDLLSFWIPGPPSTWASSFEAIWISYAAHDREPGASAYLGYTVLILSLIGVIGYYRVRDHRRKVLWWLTVMLGFTVLALGPQLQIDGQLYSFALPYHYLNDWLPFFSITGIPGRFIVITSLALAILSGYGIKRLSTYLPTRFLTTFWIGIALLIGLEYLSIPLRLTSTHPADVYHTLAPETESYALIDIKWDANFLMHAQTVHGKPLVGGWLARLPEDQALYLNQGSIEQAFLYLLLGPDSTSDLSALQTALKQRNVRYIIDHDQTATPWLKQFLGWPIIHETDDITVFSSPQSID